MSEVHQQQATASSKKADLKVQRKVGTLEKSPSGPSACASGASAGAFNRSSDPDPVSPFNFFKTT